jgi:hypothetical protein
MTIMHPGFLKRNDHKRASGGEAAALQQRHRQIFKKFHINISTLLLNF